MEEEVKIPRVQIDFKYENDPSVKQKLPIPVVSYEWSDHAEKLANSFPTYLPRLGIHRPGPFNKTPF